MKNLMIDIETLDTANTAVVTQVGWVTFNIDTISEPTEIVMDIQEQIDLGRTISASTLRFWMGQPDIARQKVFDAEYPQSVQDLRVWITAVLQDNEIERVWSHGPHFDMAILKDLMGDGIFHYRSPRDTRTLADLAPHIVKPPAVTKHSAGDDAYAQAQWIQAIWHDLECQTQGGL